MKAYLINLPDANERLQRAREAIEKAGFEWVRVEGILGRDLPFPHPDYDASSYRWMHGKRFNPAELGCYLSHLKAMEEFLETEEPFALILEDDILFQPGAKEAIEAATQYDSHWDILRLSSINTGYSRKIAKLTEGYFLNINLTRETGAGAYVVNREAAQKLIKVLLPMKLPYDHAYDKEWLWGLKALKISPLPVLQNTDEVGIPSQISTEGFKYPAWLRYWTVFPYRAYCVTCRVVYRTLRYLRLRIFRPKITDHHTS